MSKKKSFSGSTMTLKDFHGGSIPSDLPLPSAPGVIVRPADRPSFDRQGSWGNPGGRADHRLRPGSSGSMRSLDDKSPFLTNTANIGRNFDEDERKPLDGLAGPRRIVSDETIAAPPMRVEPRPDVRRFMGQQQGSASVSQVYSPGGGSFTARAPDRGTSWASGGGGGGGGHDVSSGSYPNAWGVRKETVGVADSAPSPYAGQSNVVKFAQASALDKVSSGRWQTKSVHEQADVEVIRQAESPRTYHGVNAVNERDYSERMLVMHAKRNLTLEETVQIVAKEAPAGERVRSPVLLDAKERVSSFSASSGQQPNADRKYGIPVPQLPAEASERPKLKLLPRTRPLEASEPPSLEPKQEQKFQEPNVSRHLENDNEVLRNGSHVKPGIGGGDEAGNQPVERPKLNLKPRSQPIEQVEENAEKMRMTLFGGARPRELVLKGRGVDDVVTNQEGIQSPVRVKNDTPWSETVLPHSNAVRQGERAASTNLDHKTGKPINRREQRADTQKPDLQKNNWRNENWRNSRDPQKQQERERPPSPETWHKPIEQPKPAKTDASGVRYGKAASAVELAQAFSRSVSDPKHNAAQFSGPKGIPGRSQVLFSRLTGSTTRPQINGYG